MPTYEYECLKCRHHFELFQSIKAEPTKRCPKCRGKVRRLLGAGAGLIFKGSGFYQTDYRSEGYKKDFKAAKESGHTGEAKKDSSSGKGESSSAKSDSGSSKSESGSGKSSKADSGAKGGSAKS